jgi:hypothetical protein
VGVAAAPFSASSLAVDDSEASTVEVGSLGSGLATVLPVGSGGADESADADVDVFFGDLFFVDFFFPGSSLLLDNDVLARLSLVVDDSEPDCRPDRDESEPAAALLLTDESEPESSARATPDPTVSATPTPSMTAPAPNQPYGSRTGLAR